MTMPRRIIIPIREIQRRRAINWDWHYSRHSLAREMCAYVSSGDVQSTIARHVPAPVMDICGAYVEGIATVRGRREAVCDLRLEDTTDNRSLMCVWYWKDVDWTEYVHQFQSLPEVYEDHYLYYDAEQDAILICQMSDRYNFGTTSVQVPKMFRKKRENSLFPAS
jgi:hypothetical protein